MKHQIEFVSGFILLQKPSTNYPLSIRNIFYLAISGSFIFLWGVPQAHKLCISRWNNSIPKFWCNATQKTWAVKTKSKLNIVNRNSAPKTNLPWATFVVLPFLPRLIKIKCFWHSTHPAGIYLLKVNNRNAGKRCKTCSK